MKANAGAGCPPLPPPTEGSLRLSVGLGTPCDPIYTGFVKIFHAGEWGAICEGSNEFEADRDILVIEAYAANFALEEADEVEEPIRRYWLAAPGCQGTEERLLDCSLPGGFIATEAQDRRCFISAGASSRFTLECRSFPLPGKQDEAGVEMSIP